MDETKNNGYPTASVGSESGDVQAAKNPGDGTYVGQIKDKSNTPLNLQSPLISTRSRKEKSIDNDLVSIASGLEAVSMGIFNEGEYSVSYIEGETEYYSAIYLDALNGFYIDGGLSIELSRLPTEDPVVYGSVWVDENGFLKISAGE